ncbi:hypothetical protein D3C77_724970 [compost metagenome]
MIQPLPRDRSAVIARAWPVTALCSVRAVTLTTAREVPPLAVHDPSGFCFTSIGALMALLRGAGAR